MKEKINEMKNLNNEEFLKELGELFPYIDLRYETKNRPYVKTDKEFIEYIYKRFIYIIDCNDFKISLLRKIDHKEFFCKVDHSLYTYKTGFDNFDYLDYLNYLTDIDVVRFISMMKKEKYPDIFKTKAFQNKNIVTIILQRLPQYFSIDRMFDCNQSYLRYIVDGLIDKIKNFNYTQTVNYINSCDIISGMLRENDYLLYESFFNVKYKKLNDEKLKNDLQNQYKDLNVIFENINYENYKNINSNIEKYLKIKNDF